MQVKYLIKYTTTLCSDIDDDLDQRIIINSEIKNFLSDFGEVGVLWRLKGGGFEHSISPNENELNKIIFSKLSELGECADSFIYIPCGTHHVSGSDIAYEAGLTGLFSRKDICKLSNQFNTKILCRDNDSLGVLVFIPSFETT